MKSLIKPASEKRHVNGIGRQFSLRYTWSALAVLSPWCTVSQVMLSADHWHSTDWCRDYTDGRCSFCVDDVIGNTRSASTERHWCITVIIFGLVYWASQSLSWRQPTLQSLSSTFSVLVTLSPIFTLLFTLPFQGSSLTWRKVLRDHGWGRCRTLCDFVTTNIPSSPWSALAICATQYCPYFWLLAMSIAVARSPLLPIQ